MPTNRQTRKGIGLVVAFSVSALLVAFLLTVGIGGVSDDSTFDATMDTSETRVVKGPLNITLDAVNQSSGTINVTLGDTNTGGTTQINDISGSKDGTIDGTTISVVNQNIVDSDTAELRVYYPPEYGYSSGAKSIWNIMDLILVVGIFLLWIGWALVQMRNP